MSLFVETNQIDPDKDYLPELVGDDKKYKTPVDLARAVMEKDLFINQLQTENRDVRGSLAERVKLEEIYEKINSVVNKSPNSDSDTQNTNGTNPPVIPGITPEQIDERLNAKLAELDVKRQADANTSFVKQALTKAFGPNHSSKLKEEAVKLNMTPAQMDQIAATNPSAFLRLVGAEVLEVKKDNSLFTPPVSSTATTFKPATGERTMAWYKELRKSNPVLWNSRDMVNQRHKDAHRLGEAFFDV